jgi:hypothetical protein
MEKSIGKKAKSLLVLKQSGLFNKNLLIVPILKEKEMFIDLLKSNGFIDGSEMAVRFSSDSNNINLPRSIILESFNGVYSFIKKNITDKLTAIVHDFIIPKIGGVLIKKNNKIYLEFVNGAWETESAHNCYKTIIFDNKIRIIFDSKPKECLFVNKDKLDKRVIQNTQEEVLDLVRKIYSKIKNLHFTEGLLYEFIIDYDDSFNAIEFLSLDNFSELEFVSPDHYFEIKDYKDFDNWDKKTNLLISIHLKRESDEEFLILADKIKRHSDKVYVNYGLCSHPSILLREAGLEVYPFTLGHKIIDIDL